LSDTVRNRPSPDALLAQAEAEARGKLKIYLGAAPGVGKTYEMLSDARKKCIDGVDVVAGIVETHGRIETKQLCEDLKILPRRKVAYRGRELEEMDLDALLHRRPAIALVDELAHSNAEGSRHPKRWMDVEELLAAGIDVWTTLNIQHVESLNDIVARITRVRVRETVPDAIIERADEIELIDLTPDQLIERLREGKVYAPDQARRAMRHYFAPGNLSALRELAMRRAADRIDVQVRSFRQAQGETASWAANERILVCIDERDAAEAVVRHAKRLADRARASWLAVHVQTGRDRALSVAERARVNEALRLATRLGAESATLPGDRVAETVLAYASEQNVTQIVVGKAKRPLWFSAIFGSVVGDLINHSESIAVHVVPEEIASAKPQKIGAVPSSALTPRGLIEASVATTAAIAVAVPLDRWLGVPNLGLIFLAPVLLSALRSGLWPALVTALFSVLAYDFFFTAPRMSFSVHDPQAIVSLIVFGAAAIVVSSLAAQARDQTLAARTEARTSRELLGLARALAAVASEDEVARILASYTARAFDADCVVFARVGLSGLRLAATAPGTPTLTDADMAAVHWTMDKGTPAGKGTDTLSGVRWLFIPLRTARLFSGVLAIARDAELSPAERRRMDAMADQGASALERSHIARAFEEARVEMDAEKLRATMLASLSHDLKTPIAGILGAVSSLRAYGERHDPETQAELLAGIESEADRMQRYVVKLLDMTRLDAGGVKARLEALEVSDIVSSVMKRAATISDGVRLVAEVEPGLPMVKGDGALLHQALLNLVENAVLHGGTGTVTVRVRMHDGAMEFVVLDEGPGLPPDGEAKLFEKFWRGHNTAAGGTGLGLPIVKGFAGLMGASISAHNRSDGKGAVFTLIFPNSAVLS
jgi:two-component system, OmpR family, sensor histidine kinase KdpD